MDYRSNLRPLGGEELVDVVNLADKFEQFLDYWSPKIIAEVNDMHVKLNTGNVQNERTVPVLERI